MMTKIHDGQEQLEKKHRTEEDHLMQTFKEDHDKQNTVLKKVYYTFLIIIFMKIINIVNIYIIYRYKYIYIYIYIWDGSRI